MHFRTDVKHDANVAMVSLLHHHDVRFSSVTFDKAHRQVVRLGTRGREETDGEGFRKRGDQALTDKGYHWMFEGSVTLTYFLRFSDMKPCAVINFPICCWPLPTTYKCYLEKSA